MAPQIAARGHGDLATLRRQPDSIDGVGDDHVHPDRLRWVQRVGHLQP